MDRALHFAPIQRVAALGFRIVGAMNFDHIARFILNQIGAGDEVSVHQAHFFARGEAVILGWRHFCEVLAFDPKLASKRHLSGTTSFRILWEVGDLKIFHLTLGVVGQHDFQRLQYRHASSG